MNQESQHGNVFGAGARALGKAQNLKSHIQQVYEFECRDKNGRFKWKDIIKNIVVNVGLDDILGKYYKGSNYSAAHYLGLTDGTPTVDPTDTMSSHSGWVEVYAYDEAARQAITWGSVSGQSVNNSASKAVFTISANGTTIGGAFVSTVATKNNGTGTLVGGGAFTAGDKVLDDGDTLSVTVTATAAAS
jgi:hypothetical protein